MNVDEKKPIAEWTDEEVQAALVRVPAHISSLKAQLAEAQAERGSAYLSHDEFAEFTRRRTSAVRFLSHLTNESKRRKTERSAENRATAEKKEADAKAAKEARIAARSGVSTGRVDKDAWHRTQLLRTVATLVCLLDAEKDPNITAKSIVEDVDAWLSEVDAAIEEMTARGAI